MAGIARLIGQGLAAAMLAAATLALTACALVEQHYEQRYRLTLEIETPQGVRSGSGVFQVTTVLHPLWAIGPQTDARLSGEAVAVELPNGERLFAVLLGGRDASDLLTLPKKIFGPLVGRPEFVAKGGRTYYDLEKQHRFLRSAKPSAELTGSDRPYLVRFRDIGDPLSVEAVDPDGLARVYGTGYRLRRVTLAVTEDPVSRGIDKHLPWLDRMGLGAFDGSQIVMNRDPKSNIGKADFKFGL